MVPKNLVFDHKNSHINNKAHLLALPLGNDLDSIRALFSEKEKELTLAVAKVEALTRQLEDLRKDRRGPLNLIAGLTSSTTTTIKNCTNLLVNNNSTSSSANSSANNGNNSKAAANNNNHQIITSSPTARELDKLRRELMVSLESMTVIHESNFCLTLDLSYVSVPEPSVLATGCTIALAARGFAAAPV